jgi:hypothetical protein
MFLRVTVRVFRAAHEALNARFSFVVWVANDGHGGIRLQEACKHGTAERPRIAVNAVLTRTN